MKLVILDRDGVINEDSDAYIKSAAEWCPIPGSLEAIGRLCQAGYRVFVASNQSGLGRGLFDYDALFAIHARLQKACAAFGGRIDAIEFAPDHPDFATPLRKPAPGMLLDLARRLGITLDGVPFVGDKREDIECALAAGARPVLVRSGRGARVEQAGLPAGTAVYDDLAAFAAALVGAPASP